MTKQPPSFYLTAIKSLLDEDVSMAKDKNGYFYFWNGVEATHKRYKTHTRYKTLEEAVEAALLRYYIE